MAYFILRVNNIPISAEEEELPSHLLDLKYFLGNR
jgi:hypothetical protein